MTQRKDSSSAGEIQNVLTDDKNFLKDLRAQ